MVDVTSHTQSRDVVDAPKPDPERAEDPITESSRNTNGEGRAGWVNGTRLDDDNAPHRYTSATK